MIWGSLIVGFSILLLMPTQVMLGTYKIRAIAAYTLFGLGLAFYAHAIDGCGPCELARRSGRLRVRHLQDGLVSGRLLWRGDIAAIFLALSADNTSAHWIEGVITYVGKTTLPFARRRCPRSASIS